MLDSELIINPDGSIYHLALHPEEIADVILLVGDQNRVERVSRHFDQLEVQRAKREFVTHTGRIGNKRLSVISTGIGTDNVDIVVNELDALVNIELENRREKHVKRGLTLIRLGTAGGFHESAPVDSVVTSSFAIGLDSMPLYYAYEPGAVVHPFPVEDVEDAPDFMRSAYLVAASGEIRSLFAPVGAEGITLTCLGFYGPQGRELRLKSKLTPVIPALRRFRHQDLPILNLEMETAALYFLAQQLGHQAFSISAILANRVRGEYSSNPLAAVDHMITAALDRIV
jgi:uridine phosphorylase